MIQTLSNHYCERCKKEVELGWNERQVLDPFQYDEFDRDVYVSDYQIICRECGYVIEDWGDNE